MKKLMMMFLFFSSCLGAVEIEYYAEQGAVLVPPGTVVERLADGFSWIEGPAWNSEEQFLFFSDIPNNVILKWKEGEGVSVCMEHSGLDQGKPFSGKEPGSNGLAYTQSGELLICEHGNRRVTKLSKNGTRIVIADHYQGKRLNSPNDVIEAPNGDVLFTDPPYGLAGWFDDAQKELPFQGVYLWSRGGLTLLTDAIKAPNGLGISPDCEMLYVSNSDPDFPVWCAFDFDGSSVKNPRILADVSDWMEGRRGLPDGFTIHPDGYLFAAGPGGLYVIAPSGTFVAFLDFGHPVSNCTWGDDHSVLYVTGEHVLYRIKFKNEG
jgi:gluconolactonase